MSAFFGGALLAAYLFGRAIDGIWLNLATRDWLVERVPVVAAVPDDDKAVYATIAGGLIALVMALRTARNPEVKQWSDDVSSELLKVKWPTRKEVYASTVVVLTTSAVAVIYLFLLDRFWGFVTNQIYGTGL
ncbi:MAG: preprotein translocase subunit SecE [Myxococcales bacterium]|nr:preprotein translocase subunit SecE [Myxococcales bacterium]